MPTPAPTAFRRRRAGPATAVALLLPLGCASPAPLSPPAPPPFPAEDGGGWVTPRAARPAASLPRSGSLEEYLEYAAAHNPRIEAAYARWVAASERIAQVEALPDPRLSVRWYAREVETRVGPQEWAAGVSQSFPLGGKLGLRGDEASERAAAAWEHYQGTALAIFQEVKVAWYEAWYLERAIAIVERNRDLVDDFVEVAQSLYRTGQTGYADVIRAQTELGILDDRLRSLIDLEPSLEARLSAALGLSPSSEIPWPAGAPRLPPAADIEGEAALQGILASNPELRALEHEIRGDELALELAGRAYVPDVTLGLDWIATDGAVVSGVRDDGKDPLIVGLSLNLPIWFGKYRAGQNEARARLRDSVREREDRTNLLLSETERVLYGMRDARRKIGLYRDTLIPRAEQTLEATEAAYRAGSADFLDLVDAETVLLEFELAHERARVDFAHDLARLERLLARPVFPRDRVRSDEDASQRGAEEDDR